MTTPPPRRISQRLQHRFSPRLLLLTAEGLHSLGNGQGRRARIVVARELCLFLRVDTAKIPAKQRSSFVMLAIRRAAPFPDVASDIGWIGDQALVWYWQQGRVNALMQAAGAPSQVLGFQAEALHVGAPLEDGSQLIALRRGFTGRLWKDQILIADRWWLEPPASPEWTAFQRGAGLPTAATLQPTDAGPYLLRAWAPGQAGSGVGIRGSAVWRLRIFMVLMAAALSACGVELGLGLRAAIDARRSSVVLQGLKKTSRPLEQARDSALLALPRIAALQKLTPPRGQVEVLSEIARVMPGKDWQVVSWKVLDPANIEVGLRAPGVEAAQLVSAWESSPMFADVSSAAPQGEAGPLVMKAHLLREGESKPAATPAASGQSEVGP